MNFSSNCTDTYDTNDHTIKYNIAYDSFATFQQIVKQEAGFYCEGTRERAQVCTRAVPPLLALAGWCACPRPARSDSSECPRQHSERRRGDGLHGSGERLLRSVGGFTLVYQFMSNICRLFVSVVSTGRGVKEIGKETERRKDGRKERTSPAVNCSYNRNKLAFTYREPSIVDMI